MRWLFLIPLTTSLISGYISQKSADEIAYLTGALAILSLFMSLVISPWQVQLLILVVVLAIARQLWLKIELGSQLQAQPQEEKSDRTPASPLRKYRGISYNPTASTDSLSEELEIERKYRGASYKVCEVRVGSTVPQQSTSNQNQSTDVQPRQLERKYRGISIPNPERNKKQT